MTKEGTAGEESYRERGVKREREREGGGRREQIDWVYIKVNDYRPHMTQMTLQADAEKVRRSSNSTRVASHRTAPQRVSAPATPNVSLPRHAITQVDLTQFRSDPFSAIRRFATGH